MKKALVSILLSIVVLSGCSLRNNSSAFENLINEVNPITILEKAKKSAADERNLEIEKMKQLAPSRNPFDGNSSDQPLSTQLLLFSPILLLAILLSVIILIVGIIKKNKRLLIISLIPVGIIVCLFILWLWFVQEFSWIT
jgi:hypothetical protein